MVSRSTHAASLYIARPSIYRRPHTLLSIHSLRTDGGMKAVANRLSKLRLNTVKISYSPTYTNFILNHIATNPAHPLHISQRRRQQDHKKEGLWWHATNATDISKSGCVRTWTRRRLRQAFIEELKAKGYDETGKLVDATAMQDRRDVVNVLRLGRSVDLIGSLRIHGVGPLLPAKFEKVKEEVRGILDALIQSSVDSALGFSGEGEKNNRLGQRPERAGALPQSRKVPERRKTVASVNRDVVKKKPGSATVEAAKELLRVEPRAPSQPSTRAANTPNGPGETAAASAPPRTEPQSVASEARPRVRWVSLLPKET